MDYKTLAAQLVKDREFCQDYTAVSKLDQYMRAQLARLHGSRLAGHRLAPHDGTALLNYLTSVPYTAPPSPTGRRAGSTFNVVRLSICNPPKSTISVDLETADEKLPRKPREIISLNESTLIDRFFRNTPFFNQANQTEAALSKDIMSKNFITTQTLVAGVNFDHMTDDDVFGRLTSMSAELKKLKEAEVKPAFIVDRIKTLEDNIAALTKLADDRYTKAKAKDDAAAKTAG